MPDLAKMTSVFEVNLGEGFIKSLIEKGSLSITHQEPPIAIRITMDSHLLDKLKDDPEEA